jgi:hypothetical protein
MPRLFCAVFLLAFAVSSHDRLPTRSASVGSVSPGPQMLEPRSGHTATLLPNGKVLIAGGMRRNQDFFRSAELFDPATGRFDRTGEMHIDRVGHAAALLRSGKVLIAGGWVAGSGPTDRAEIYDPATGTFTEIARMHEKRAHPTVTLLSGGDVLIAGGVSCRASMSCTLASTEIFRPGDASFYPGPAMLHGRVMHSAVLLANGKVLIAAGRSGDAVTSSAELYDPSKNSFTPTGPLRNARYKHTAAVLPDGRVLLAGGSDDRDWHGQMASAEIYDPKTGTFSAASALCEPRFKLPDKAVVLPSGEVLIAGGNDSAELFDPATAAFKPVPGSMQDSRHYMSETLLPNGRVLMAGGYYNSDEATAQTWIYAGQR